MKHKVWRGLPQVRQHCLERRQIAMNVRQDGDPHTKSPCSPIIADLSRKAGNPESTLRMPIYRETPRTCSDPSPKSATGRTHIYTKKSTKPLPGPRFAG